MKAKNWFAIVMGVLLLIVVGLYVYQATFFSSHFFPKDSANGVKIGDLTVAEAEQVLTKQSDNEQFQLTQDGVVWKEVAKKDLGVEYNFKQGLTKTLNAQNRWLWPVAYFKGTEHQLAESTLNEESLAAYTQTLTKELETLNESRTPSKNASIENGDNGFAIVPEVVGNDLNLEKITTALPEQLKSGKSTLELNSFQNKPSVTAEDPKLKENLTEISQITAQNVEYYINGQTIKLSAADISNWINYDSTNNKVDLDKEKVRTYVANLGQEYNTSTNPTIFKSTRRGEVSVPAGTYSWTIQTDTETEELYTALLEGKGVQRSPIAQGSASSGAALIGNTYIEVDLVNQHMYYYKDGAVALETDIVSGKPTTPTPPGVNYVWNKALNETLRGTNDDGSKYAEPVDYWMPIDWTGVGIHDSPWQPAYGGQLWKTVGSHGCINTPPGVMAKLYGMIQVGVPVLVF